MNDEPLARILACLKEQAAAKRSKRAKVRLSFKRQLLLHKPLKAPLGHIELLKRIRPS